MDGLGKMLFRASLGLAEAADEEMWGFRPLVDEPHQATSSSGVRSRGLASLYRSISGRRPEMDLEDTVLRCRGYPPFSQTFSGQSW